MFKKLIFILLFVGLSFSVSAKDNQEFKLSGKKEFKPKNMKILKKDWSRGLKAGGPSKRYYPQYSNPVYEDGVIYVGTHGKMFYALHSSNGKTIWEYENDEPISTTPAVYADKVYFTDLGGRVICLNKTTGQQVWKRDFGHEMLGKPLLSGDRLYILKGEQEVMALNNADGSVVWSRLVRTYIRKITMRGQSSVVLDGGSLYVGLADGHLYRLNAKDGKITWDKNLNIPLRAFKDIDAHVMIEGDSIYVGGYFGAFYRLSKKSGQIKWTADVATGLAPLILENVVVVSDMDGIVVGLDKEEGGQIWFNELESGVISAPALYDQKVFVSSFEKGAYLLDTVNGHQIQKLVVGDGSINRPLVVGDRIYVLTNGAKLVALGRK